MKMNSQIKKPHLKMIPIKDNYKSNFILKYLLFYIFNSLSLLFFLSLHLYFTKFLMIIYIYIYI